MEEENDAPGSPYPRWLSATLASDAAEGRGVLPSWIKALHPGCQLTGIAFVILACEDDNLAVRNAMAGDFPQGCVLVVGGHSTSRTATIGGLMALELQQRGVAGLITDGLVRDAEELKQLRFPVWCRGTTPIASAKRNPGVLGGAISVGGALVSHGDLVIADDDGVVIWPQANYERLLARAQEKRDADDARLAQLRARQSDSPGSPGASSEVTQAG